MYVKGNFFRLQMATERRASLDAPAPADTHSSEALESTDPTPPILEDTHSEITEPIEDFPALREDPVDQPQPTDRPHSALSSLSL
jgi:hypothetical protein